MMERTRSCARTKVGTRSATASIDAGAIGRSVGKDTRSKALGKSLCRRRNVERAPMERVCSSSVGRVFDVMEDHRKRLDRCRLLSCGRAVEPVKFERGRLVLTAAGCLMMAVSLFAIPVVSPDYGGLPALLGVCVLLSLGNAVASPSLSSLVSRISDEDQQGSSLGIMQSGASLARAIGPTLGGVLMNNAFNRVDDTTLYRTFWTASAIMMVALIAWLVFITLGRKELEIS